MVAPPALVIHSLVMRHRHERAHPAPNEQYEFVRPAVPCDGARELSIEIS